MSISPRGSPNRSGFQLLGGSSVLFVDIGDGHCRQERTAIGETSGSGWRKLQECADVPPLGAVFQAA